jgi:hypothetical protein
MQGRLLLESGSAADFEVSFDLSDPNPCQLPRESVRTAEDGTFELGGQRHPWGCPFSPPSWRNAAAPIFRPLLRFLLAGAASDCTYSARLQITPPGQSPLRVLVTPRWAPGCPRTWQVTCGLGKDEC